MNPKVIRVIEVMHQLTEKEKVVYAAVLIARDFELYREVLLFCIK